MAEFTKPSFLLNRSTNDNHAKMREIIPADIDMSEGGHAWNMTRPTALIAAEIQHISQTLSGLNIDDGHILRDLHPALNADAV